MGGVFRASSSGLASGNHPLEAVAHGLCELIERDAWAIWMARGGPQQTETRLDLQSVDDAAVQTLLGRIARAEALVSVWELTADTGIPTFFCELVDRPEQARLAVRGRFGGQGCHLDSRVALLRAITEAAQSRLTHIAGSRDDMFSYHTRAHPDDMRLAVKLAQQSGYRPFGASDQSTSTFENDLTALLRSLVAVGVDRVAVVDLSRSGMGIPVVKVVVAGLETDPRSPGERANRGAAVR
jgi:ribosomal protein S12 methylthiotransferase accessory factor